MKLLAKFRDGKEGAEEEAAMTEFIRLCQELFDKDADRPEKSGNDEASQQIQIG
jgi:hypothetical protein